MPDGRPTPHAPTQSPARPDTCRDVHCLTPPPCNTSYCATLTLLTLACATRLRRRARRWRCSRSVCSAHECFGHGCGLCTPRPSQRSVASGSGARRTPQQRGCGRKQRPLSSPKRWPPRASVGRWGAGHRSPRCPLRKHRAGARARLVTGVSRRGRAVASLSSRPLRQQHSARLRGCPDRHRTMRGCRRSGGSQRKKSKTVWRDRPAGRHHLRQFEPPILAPLPGLALLPHLTAPHRRGAGRMVLETQQHINSIQNGLITFPWASSVCTEYETLCRPPRALTARARPRPPGSSPVASDQWTNRGACPNLLSPGRTTMLPW